MKKNILSPDLQVSLPTLGLLGVLILSIYLLYSFGLSTLYTERDKLAQTKKDHSVLTEKQQVLSGLSQNILPQADASLIAVPGQNPSLLVVSQIKSLANQNSLTIKDISVSSPNSQGDLNSVGLTLSLEGQTGEIINFINGLKSLAPLVFLNALKITNANQISDASVNIVSYSSDLPKKITSLTEPLISLTDDENKILNRLSSLIAPSQVQLAPTEPTTRDNPFN